MSHALYRGHARLALRIQCFPDFMQERMKGYALTAICRARRWTGF